MGNNKKNYFKKTHIHSQTPPFWPMTTARTTWSSSCIHLFKQLKNNETFLDIPAIAFYPSALAAAWQLLIWPPKYTHPLKKTLQTSTASLFACKVINFERLETKASVLITRSKQREQRVEQLGTNCSCFASQADILTTH